MRSARVVVRPNPQVRAVDGMWVHDRLGIREPAPPACLERTSSRDDVGRAEAVLESGLASTVVVGRPRLFGSSPVTPTRSRAVPAGGVAASWMVVLGTARAFAPLIGVAVLAAVVTRVVGEATLALLADCALILLFSYVVHEWGHAVAYRRLAPAGASALLVTRRFRVYLVRERLPWKRDLAVTAAGPLAPGLLAVASLLGFRAWPLYILATSAIWIGHVLLLALPGGDGRSLRHALGEAVSGARPVDAGS